MLKRLIIPKINKLIGLSLAAIMLASAALSAFVIYFDPFIKNVDAAETGAVYEIGPGKQYEEIGSMTAPPWSELQYGDTVLIYAKENNEPYLVPTITSGGLAFNISMPGVTVSGVPDEYGNRPVITRAGNTISAGTENILVITANDVVIENLVVDGGLFDLIEYLNGESGAGNRFGANDAAAYPGETVTLSNFYSFLNRKSDKTPAQAFGWQMPNINSLMNFIYKFGKGATGGNHKFAGRGIFHSNGDNLIVRNCLAIGAGTGLQSADTGPGSSYIEDCEFAYNGMDFAGHNVYMNGDNGRYPDMSVTFVNNFIHHSLCGSMGLRSRVTRTNLYNNYFLDNAGKQNDLISQSYVDNGYRNMLRQQYISSGRDKRWETGLGLRMEYEIIGNLYVYTEDFVGDHVRIGGGGSRMSGLSFDWSAFEESYGRYRFVNNTFVSLNHGYGDNDATSAISAQYGVDSVEMYNNIFYSKNENTHAPFLSYLTVDDRDALLAGNEEWQQNWDDISAFFIDEFGIDEDEVDDFMDAMGYAANQWALGIREVAGSNNWVSSGMVDTQMPRITGEDECFGNMNNWDSEWDGEIIWFHDCIPNVWVDTIMGGSNEDPFVDSDNFDFRVASGSSADITGVPVGTVNVFQTEESHNALDLPN